tara:strand:+ start:70 stop:753 length:684 start_codon:yes stop_codon:yes gene_type:complete
MNNEIYNSQINPSVETFRENFRANNIPWWYVPELHVGTNIVIILAVLGYSFYNVENLTLMESLTIPLMLIGGNFFVWIFHKYPLHRPFKIMPMAYKIHTLAHHHFFTDEAIIYRDKKDFIILFFPIHFVLPVNGILFPTLGYFSIKYGVLAPNVAHLIVAMAAVYLVLYEVFHFVSHLPEGSKILRIPIFKNAWVHHRHHHTKKLMGKYNFNIVFPLFDRLFKTYYR